MEAIPISNDEDPLDPDGGHCAPMSRQQPFSVFVEQYAHRVFAFIRKRVRQDADAQDLTQETFKNVIRSHATFDPSKSAWPWLCQIASNCIREALRRQSTLMRNGITVQLREFQDPHDGPIALLSRDERRETVRKAMQELAPEDRQILEQHYFDRETIETIARKRGLSKDAINSRLYRARQRLRDLLEPRIVDREELNLDSSKLGGTT